MGTEDKNYSNINIVILITFLLTVVLSGCGGAADKGDSGNGGNTEPDPQTSQCVSTYTLFVNNNIDNSAVVTVQGGLIYDNWWKALGYSFGPTVDQPMWSMQSDNARSGEETWRCKECHGWDYKGADGAYGDTASDHYTGFAGILGAGGKEPIDVFCAIRDGVGVNTGHAFNEDTTDNKISDLAILQLTKFITRAGQSPDTEEGMINMETVINSVTGASSGNAANGANLYNITVNNLKGCDSANCHGTDGMTNMDEEGGLGGMASENPWEVLHKIRFGHPGAALMPAFSDPKYGGGTHTLNDSADIIAYAQQTLSGGGGTTPPPPPPVGSDAEVISLGARLYDNWIEEKGVASPPLDNPLWSLQTTNTRIGADTWRCKECHGWDYKGANGNYGPNSSHYTGFGGVWETRRDEAELVNLLTGGFYSPILGENVHIFLGLMTTDELGAIAKFIKAGTVDTSDYIASSGIIVANLSNFNNGNELYTSKPFGIANGNCELCHGSEGTSTTGVVVGAEAVANPWEVLHKVRFGQPGSIMPSMFEAGLTIQDSVDVVFYAQSLPKEAPPSPAP